MRAANERLSLRTLLGLRGNSGPCRFGIPRRNSGPLPVRPEGNRRAKGQGAVLRHARPYQGMVSTALDPPHPNPLPPGERGVPVRPSISLRTNRRGSFRMKGGGLLDPPTPQPSPSRGEGGSGSPFDFPQDEPGVVRKSSGDAAGCGCHPGASPRGRGAWAGLPSLGPPHPGPLPPGERGLRFALRFPSGRTGMGWGRPVPLSVISYSWPGRGLRRLPPPPRWR